MDATSKKGLFVCLLIMTARAIAMSNDVQAVTAGQDTLASQISNPTTTTTTTTTQNEVLPEQQQQQQQQQNPLSIESASITEPSILVSTSATTNINALALIGSTPFDPEGFTLDSLHSSDSIAAVIFVVTLLMIPLISSRIATKPIQTVLESSKDEGDGYEEEHEVLDEVDDSGNEMEDDSNEGDGGAQKTLLEGRKSKCGSKFPEHHMQASEVNMRPKSAQVMNAEGDIVNVESTPVVNSTRAKWSDNTLSPKHLVMSNFSAAANHIPPIPLHFIPSITPTEPPPLKPWTAPAPRKVQIINELCTDKAPTPMLRGGKPDVNDCSENNPFCRKVNCEKIPCQPQTNPIAPFRVDAIATDSKKDRKGESKTADDWVNDPLKAPVWADPQESL